MPPPLIRDTAATTNPSPRTARRVMAGSSVPTKTRDTSATIRYAAAPIGTDSQHLAAAVTSRRTAVSRALPEMVSATAMATSDITATPGPAATELGTTTTSPLGRSASHQRSSFPGTIEKTRSPDSVSTSQLFGDSPGR